MLLYIIKEHRITQNINTFKALDLDEFFYKYEELLETKDHDENQEIFIKMNLKKLYQ